MDCRVFPDDFYGSEQFTGPDGLKYDKVNITSGWNQLCLCLYETYSTPISSSIVSIHIGEYSYDELLNALYSSIETLVQNINGQNNYITFSHDNFILSENLSFNINNILSSLNSYDIDKEYILKSLNQPVTQLQFEFPQSEYNDQYFVAFIQVENGIDKILPFTIPIPTYPYLEDYIIEILENFDGIHTFQTYTIFNHASFFKLIWLHPYFFSQGYPYENDIIIYNIFMEIGLPRHETNNYIIFYLPGIYTPYGLLMSILLQLWNWHMNDINFIPTTINNYDVQFLHLTNDNNRFILCDYEENYNENNITGLNIYNSNYESIAIYYNLTHPDPITESIQIPSSGFNDILISCKLINPNIYSVTSGSLPSGLSMNEGIIINTANTISESTSTLTIKNNTTFKLIIKVVDIPDLTYQNKNIFNVNENFTINPITTPSEIFNYVLTTDPETGKDIKPFGSLKYTINNIPNTISINSSTGEITGYLESKQNITGNISCNVIANFNNTVLEVNYTTTINISIQSPKYNIYIVDNIFDYQVNN